MPDVASADQSLGLRKSSRQSLPYKSDQAERKCIICNKDWYTQGQLIRSVDGTYKAEGTLKEYAEIY